MDTIYYNGKIITMAYHTAAEETENMPQAIFVRNGIISETGTFDHLNRKYPKAKKVNLCGKCLMPAFIDPHSHSVMNGQMALCADLSGCESFDDIVEALKEFITKKKISAKNSVIGFGYDHNFLREAAHPDKKILDRASSEIPIMILHVSGHLACANSAALTIAGVDENTPNPDGGVIGRYPGSREPNGYFEESGMGLIQLAIRPRMKINIFTILKNVQKLYYENGITTIQDGATTSQDFKLLDLMAKLGLLKLDVVSYPLLSAGGKELTDSFGKYDGKYCRHLKIGGYKLVLDGSPQGRSAWMSEPYLGEPDGYCAYPWMKDEEVNEYVKQAVSEKKQILAHCNGDAASQQFLNAYEKALHETDCTADLRPVMIHCQTVRNDQLDRMASIKMIASVFVGHVWYWGDIHLSNFGEKRGNRISPSADILRRGIHMNFHQDTPVTKPYMLHSVWCAVNRISRCGRVIGADQKIPVYDALRSVTIEGAYQYFEEASKGSIEIGKHADLVILDRSPLDVDPASLRNIRVLETIKDGKSIWKQK